MRVVATPVLCLLVLAGLAALPPASAAPPDPCDGTIGGTQAVGPVTVFASPPCYDVYVDAMDCPLGNGGWTDLKVRTVGVHVYACSEDPAATSASTPCTCPPPPTCTSVTTVGPVSEVVSVTVTGDCRVIVAVLPYLVACNDPLDGAKAITAGRVTVSLPCGEIGPCEPPLECYPTSAAALFIPPVCIWKEVAVGPAKAGADLCRESHETSACSSPQRIHHYEQAGPAYAQLDLCFPHSPPPDLAAAAASEPGPCGVQQRCPAPVPLCSGLAERVPAYGFESAGPVGADVDVASNCHTDVYVKADVMDCLWGEGYNQAASAGPVTVWTWGCRPFEPSSTQTAAMADPFPTCVRECTPPVVPDGCDLRAATPTTVGPFLLPFDPQQAVWGDDCDIDVDPIGACAPPSGKRYDVERLFLDVSLLVCDGGVGDVAGGWS